MPDSCLGTEVKTPSKGQPATLPQENHQPEFQSDGTNRQDFGKSMCETCYLKVNDGKWDKWALSEPKKTIEGSVENPLASKS